MATSGPTLHTRIDATLARSKRTATNDNNMGSVFRFDRAEVRGGPSATATTLETVLPKK